MGRFSTFRGNLAIFLKPKSLWVMVSLSTMLISISGVILITVLINRRFDDLIDHSTVQNSSQIVENAVASIDNYLYGMLTTLDSITTILERIMEHSHATLSEDLAEFFEHSDINTIAVFDSGANVIAQSSRSDINPKVDFTQQEWFTSAISDRDGYHIGAPKVQRLYESEYPWVISLSRALSVDSFAGNSIVVLMDINIDSLRELSSFEVGQYGYLYIIGHDAQIIYHPFQQIIYAGIDKDDIQMVADYADGDSIIESGGERASLSVRTLETTGWRVVGVSPLIGFFTRDNDIYNFINIIVFFTILMIIASAVIVSILLTRPIRKLVAMMSHVETGSFDEIYQIKGVYEVNELSQSFVQMVHRVRNLMEKVREEQEQVLKDQVQLSEIEMKFLHAQLNPHFLYNTLDSVVWLAESGDQKSVVKMTEALSNFFRLTLSGGHEVIPLENELKHAENYLIIQKMRYSERFDYTITNDLKSSGYFTLKNIVQPILENSIVHGVANMLEICHINVRAYSEGEKLIIQVKDNGSGIKPSVLECILEPKPGSKSGIGIYNVNKRIQLLYGNEYGLKYESEPDEGTTVSIIMPGTMPKDEPL